MKLDECVTQWNPEKLYAPFFPSIQRSLSGKSRTAESFQDYIYTCYMCFRKSESTGFPKKSNVDFLTDSSKNIYFLWIALFGEIFQLISEVQEPKDFPGKFQDLLKNNNVVFESYETVLSKADVHIGDYQTLEPAMTQYLTDKFECCKEKLQKKVDIKLGDVTYNSTTRVLIEIDEGSSLTKAKSGVYTHFELIRYACRALPKNCNVCVNITDTTSTVANFWKPSGADKSLRIARGHLELPAPFVAFNTCDVLEKVPLTMEESISEEIFLSQGYPYWKLLLENQMTFESIFNIAIAKIAGGVSLDFIQKIKEYSTCQFLAIVGSRLCMAVNPSSENAEELVSSHLKTLMYADNKNSIKIWADYVSEPIVCEAAAHLMYDYGILSRSAIIKQFENLFKHAVLDKGEIGELVGRFILLMAWDDACFSRLDSNRTSLKKCKEYDVGKYTRNDSCCLHPWGDLNDRSFKKQRLRQSSSDLRLWDDNSRKMFMSQLSSDEKRGMFFPPMRLWFFLLHLFGSSVLQKLVEENSNVVNILNGFVRINQFIRITYNPTLDDLVAFFKRGIAVISKNNAPGDDFKIPVFVGNWEETLSVNKFCVILIQIRNVSGKDSKLGDSKGYKLSPGYCGMQDYPSGRAYLGLYLNLGSKEVDSTVEATNERHLRSRRLGGDCKIINIGIENGIIVNL